MINQLIIFSTSNAFTTFITSSYFARYNNTFIKPFIHDKGTFATNLSPSNVSKYFSPSKLSLTFVKPLNVLCSSIIPYLLILKQYSFLVLKREQRKHFHPYSHFSFVVIFHLINQLFPNYPIVYFRNRKNQLLRIKHHLYKIH